MAIKFTAIVNPFLQKVLISTRLDGVAYEEVINYSELDHWECVSMGDKVFDIHILYDDELEISAYDVERGDTLTNSPHFVKFKLTSITEF